MRVQLASFTLFLILLFDQVGAAEPARIHFYLFDNGIPVPGVELRTDTDSLGITDRDGALHLKYPEGEYSFKLIRDSVVIHTLPLVLSANESILLIATLGQQGKISLEIESSHQEQHLAVNDESENDERAGDGPKALLSGDIVTFQEKTPVPGARVFISGVSQRIQSDTNGHFEVQLPVGEYSVSVIHPDFSSQTLEAIQLTTENPVSKRFELTPNALALEEYTVTAPYLAGSFSALADEQRNTQTVAEVFSAEQMSNSGDSDAAGALKRVTGLTVVDDKFVFVRGLGERYSSTTLNGAGLPSPDPTSRTVPLDLFPTGVLGSLVIQKTYSPDMPGEFGGGTVQLRTRNLPEERLRRISVSTGGNSLSTFQDGKNYEGGATDFLGIDDGTREFPATLDRLTHGGSRLLSGRSDEEIEAAGESLPRIYDVRNASLPPDIGVKLNLGDRWEDIDGKWGWGYLFGFNYKNQWRNREEERATFGLGSRSSLRTLDETTLEKTENEIDLSGILHLGFELGNNHTFESTTLLSRKTSNSVVQEEGFLSENAINIRDTTLEWVERQLFLEQLHGNHILPQYKDLEVDWRATYSNAQRDEPDTRFYRYEQRSDGLYAFSEEGQSNETSFEDLDDTNLNLSVDFSLPVYNFLSNQTILKFGLGSETKERDSQFSRFRFLTDFSRNNIDTDLLLAQNPENILSAEWIGPDGYRLRNTTLPTDNYRAEQTIDSTYVMADLTYDHVKALVGVRQEHSQQAVTTFQLTNPDQAVTAKLDDSDTLPAVSVTWLLHDEQQIRFGYGETVNRPDFKELSEAPYIDPDSRNIVIGNPLLKRSTIQHFDVRWERYLTKFEMLATAFFYKAFDQPIEQVIRLGAGGIHTFANAESATNYGLEFQGRSWLSRFFGKDWARFYVETNVSLIESEVALGNAGAQQTNTQRPLQGQSPWVVNFSLGYENLITTSKAQLLFNLAGERIASVGTKGLPDAYEQPVPLLDLVYSKTLREGDDGSKLKFKMKLKNLLDPRIETLRGDEVERTTHKGVSFDASIEYKFP